MSSFVFIILLVCLYALISERHYRYLNEGVYHSNVSHQNVFHYNVESCDLFIKTFSIFMFKNYSAH